MAPGRPPKRPGEPDMESPDGPAKCKLPRLNSGGAPNDFSSVVKSKLQSYTRTGQACDRCKVRKIRCDALPEGCSHCINQNLECYVTDRVTGRTERRGYMQELEREKNDMVSHIRDLERLLGANGIEVKPWSPGSSPVQPQHDGLHGGYDGGAGGGGGGGGGGNGGGGGGGAAGGGASKENWTQINSVWVKSGSRDLPKTQFNAPIARPMLDQRPADVHLGVGVDQGRSSSIKGTTLSILGSTIDVGSFDGPDMDEPAAGAHAHARSPLYNKSVRAMMQSACGVNPPVHVEYPPRADAFTYVEWYFLIVYPFLPILHKPSFMDLLSRLYDDPTFKPSVAESVMVHMVFASIYLQYSLRNQESPQQRTRLNELSNKHYHYACSKFCDLTTSRTFADLQALTMISVHTRSFPKPDCSGMLTHYCVGFATELGLHRSSKKSNEGTDLETEMRKRVWWIIVSMVVTLNGRMGRPMGLQLADCDVPFPEMIPDEMLTANGVDSSRGGKCLYEIGVMNFKFAAIFLEMYSTLYCARRDPRSYLHIVEELEAKAEAWRNELPESLKRVHGDENQMQALWVKNVEAEFRLLVRHPSVAMTQDPKVLAENTRICEQASKDMLHCVYELFKLKSIDTTWYALAVYIAAIFSALAAVWERRNEVSAAEVDALRQDMNLWLIILTETANIIGTDTTLHDSVSSIIDRTISWIERDRQRRVNGSGPLQVTQDMLKQSPQSTPYSSSLPSVPTVAGQGGGAEGGAGNTTSASAMASSRNGYYGAPGHEPNTYSHMPYGDSAHGTSNLGGYETDHHQFLYAQAAAGVNAHHVPSQGQAQAQTQASAPGHAGQTSHAQTPVGEHPNALSSFTTQATQMAQPTSDMMWRQTPGSAGGNTWQDWTAAVVDNQDRYSANALMSLGHTVPRSGGSIVNDGSGAAHDLVGMSGTGVPATAGTMQWPLLLFHDGTNVGGA